MRYFAVSDRYNNWVPDDYEDGTYDNPANKDTIRFFAPGNKIRCIYPQYYDGGSVSFYDEVIKQTDLGVSNYSFKLANGDGRFFEALSNLADNWSFEEDEDNDGMPDGWTVTIVSNENAH